MGCPCPAPYHLSAQWPSCVTRSMFADEEYINVVERMLRRKTTNYGFRQLHHHLKAGLHGSLTRNRKVSFSSHMGVRRRINDPVTDFTSNKYYVYRRAL